MPFEPRVEIYTFGDDTYRLTLTPTDEAGAALLAQWAPPEDTYLSDVMVGEAAMEPKIWVGLLFSLEGKPYWDAFWNPATPRKEWVRNQEMEEEAYKSAVFYVQNQKTPETLAELRTPLMFLALHSSVSNCMETEISLGEDVPFVQGAQYAMVQVVLEEVPAA